MNMQDIHSIRYQIPKVINSTPMEILRKINTHSLQGFSRYIKHTIIQSYQELFTKQNDYGQAFCLCCMHFTNCTHLGIGARSLPIYLILCIYCYFFYMMYLFNQKCVVFVRSAFFIII